MVLPAALKATAFLLPTIYLILWYKVSLVTTGLLYLLGSCFELYPIFEGTHLSSILAVILARVLVPPLELSRNDVYMDELLTPFIRVFPKVLIVCHTVAEGTCELVHNDNDHCPIRYVGVRVQSINFIKIILYWGSLPKFVNPQVYSICAVMVSII